MPTNSEMWDVKKYQEVININDIFINFLEIVSYQCRDSC